MNKFMRLILFYDLDFSNETQKKLYNKFHNWIIRRGYIMMQYSVYIKIINLPIKATYEIEQLKKKLPKNSHVRVLTITDSQYYRMKILKGSKRINESINTEQRRIIIDKPY